MLLLIPCALALRAGVRVTQRSLDALVFGLAIVPVTAGRMPAPQPMAGSASSRARSISHAQWGIVLRSAACC